MLDYENGSSSMTTQETEESKQQVNMKGKSGKDKTGLDEIKEEEETKSVQRRKKYGKDVFSVNTSFCRSELELIQHVIFENGFMVIRHD